MKIRRCRLKMDQRMRIDFNHWYDFRGSYTRAAVFYPDGTIRQAAPGAPYFDWNCEPHFRNKKKNED